MLIVSEIIERLKDVLSQDGINGKIFDKDVANALGLSQLNFATMKSRNKIPFTNILDFCALRKISINWLLYNQNPSSLLESTDKYWIKYYSNIRVSAGGGAYEDEENFEILEVPQYFASMLGGVENFKNLEAINVIGDSMEPTLNSNNIIFLDKKIKDFTKDGIYAFTTINGLFVKRVEKRKDGTFDIISDNSEYSSQILSKDEFSIIGRVIGSFGNVF